MQEPPDECFAWTGGEGVFPGRKPAAPLRPYASPGFHNARPRFGQGSVLGRPAARRFSADTSFRKAPAASGPRPLTRAVEGPATDDHRSAPDQKADIPVDPLVPRDGLVDVVQAKQVVVDHAFNDVESTETHQHRPGEEFQDHQRCDRCAVRHSAISPSTTKT